MASLKELKNRIASVKSTRKITKARKMVAAAKLRRAQEAATAARPYAERMDAILANLATSIMKREGASHSSSSAGHDAVLENLAESFADSDSVSKLLFGTGKDDVHLLIVMTSERGLCGGFNSSIAKIAREHARKLMRDGKTVKIMTVGRKGAEALAREFGSKIDTRISYRGMKRVGFEQANEVADQVMAKFEAGEFDIATMFFAEFKSVIAQIPTALQLIPAKIEANVDADESTQASAVYDYEPEEDVILDYLLKRNITTQIFRGILENAASEQGARMSAMDSATRNAGEMIDKLSITYNRERQAKITKELIEIISGAEAL